MITVFRKNAIIVDGFMDIPGHELSKHSCETTVPVQVLACMPSLQDAEKLRSSSAGALQNAR